MTHISQIWDVKYGESFCAQERTCIMNANNQTTRDRIVEAAIQLFLNNPYEAVSVKDVCDAAGVTRNSFYYYFESKEIIFDAIGDWVSRTAKSRLLSALTARTSYQQVWEIYRNYLDVQIEMGPEIMNHICASRTLKGRSDYYSYIDDRLSRVMTRLIANAQKDGEIRNDQDPAILMTTSYAILRGVNIKWCFQWGEIDIYKECEEALNALFIPNEGYELQ